MQPVLALIDRVGPSDANVLITGEHGTGKEVIARVLHAASRRASRPLITVNLGGLSETLFLSELFGHVKGAYTDARADRVGRFELADQGTLFLDEIGNIPVNQQANLLRVLETGEMERVGSSRTIRVNTRIVSATNSDLKAAVREGRFREDLLFRLNTVNIHLPPLRNRREDIPRLAMHFLGQYSQKYEKAVGKFDGPALNAMGTYPWPGNVRELDHVVERAVLMARSEVIHSDDLGLSVGGDRLEQWEDMTLENVERLLISRVLKRTGGNVSEAADSLGLSRSALYRRMEKYGL
jgi:DNA-binding NtrC family response regulator